MCYLPIVPEDEEPRGWRRQDRSWIKGGVGLLGFRVFQVSLGHPFTLMHLHKHEEMRFVLVT